MERQDAATLVVVSDDSTEAEVQLITTGKTVELREAKWRTRYEINHDGGLAVERRSDSRVTRETWPSGLPGVASFEEDGRRAAGGELGATSGGKSRYVETSAEGADWIELEVGFAIADGVFESVVDSVEPLFACKAAGLGAVVKGYRALDRFALLDYILGWRQRMTPLLVRAALE